MANDNVDVGKKRLNRKPDQGIRFAPKSLKRTQLGAAGAMSQQSCDIGNQSVPQKFVRLVGYRDPKDATGAGEKIVRIPDRIASLDEFATFLNRNVPAPRHDRYRGGRILRRSLNQLVGIDHIDQHVPLGVAPANDLHLLEEQ